MRLHDVDFLFFSSLRVQLSNDSEVIELPSDLIGSDVYAPESVWCSTPTRGAAHSQTYPRRCHLPPPTPLWIWRRNWHTWWAPHWSDTAIRFLTYRLRYVGSMAASSLEGKSSPTSAGKTFPNLYPLPMFGFGGEKVRSA